MTIRPSGSTRAGAHTEEVGDLGGAVLAAVHEGDQVRLLASIQFRLLAAKTALGLGDFHALAGAQPDQVGLELRHHGQHVEQQPLHRVGGVVDRPAQTQADLPRGELVDDRSGVGQGSGQAIELGHHQGVPGSARGQRFTETRSLAVGAGQPMVDVDPLHFDAKTPQGVTLGGEILSIVETSGVPDKQRAYGAPPGDEARSVAGTTCSGSGRSR